MPELNRNQFYPSQQQLAIPGLDQPEQMRLFDTRRAGPANVYTANPSPNAADWKDRDLSVDLSTEGQEILDDESYEVQGRFSTFPLGEDARAYVAYGQAHGDAIRASRDDGTYLGHDAYPERVHPDLRFGDLDVEDASLGEDITRWNAPDGTVVGEVDWEPDRWGPYVNTAEINPLYRGRGFTREAIPDFAGIASEYTRGIVHAGSYTDAGAGAFHAKGVPTTSDIERGYEDYVDREVSEIPVESLKQDALENMRGGEVGLDQGWDWEAPEDTWSSAQRDALGHEVEYLTGYFRESMLDDPETTEQYLDQLEGMQEAVLSKLPGRRSAFEQGWKPQAKFGRQEEFPELEK